MRTFRVIVADAPWRYEDGLRAMKARTKRAAEQKYPVLDLAAIRALPVRQLADKDGVLGFWCPCSMLEDGIGVMRAWGFRQTQQWTWVKLTTQADEEITVSCDGQIVIAQKAALGALAGLARKADRVQGAPAAPVGGQGLVVDVPLAFGNGRIARAAKEVFLVGVRGRAYRHLRDKSTRDVFFAAVGEHSEKPECFQDALDRMFPEGERLELFARRARPGWVCVGNQAPATPGEDIRDTLARLLGGETPKAPASALERERVTSPLD